MSTTKGFGALGEKVMCPEGYFVSGFQAQIEPSQGNKDDSALNGLIFRCRSPYSYAVKDITIFNGLEGEWREMREGPPN